MTLAGFDARSRSTCSIEKCSEIHSSLRRTNSGRWSLLFVSICIGLTLEKSLTPWLTGAGARSAEGTDMGHENGEAMAHVGVRVEPPVRLGRVVEERCCWYGPHFEY